MIKIKRNIVGTVNKKEIILQAVKKSKLYTPDNKDLEKITDDILKKSSFIFGISMSENEIFDYLKSVVDATIIKINEDKKGKDGNMELLGENFELVPDPITLSFDKSREEEYLNKILTKLYEIEEHKPEKTYASIFYERYIEGLDTSMIAKMHNVEIEEINNRIIDMAKAVNKD